MAMNHSGSVKPLQQSNAREDLSPLRNTAQRASSGLVFTVNYCYYNITKLLLYTINSIPILEFSLRLKRGHY